MEQLCGRPHNCSILSRAKMIKLTAQDGLAGGVERIEPEPKPGKPVNPRPAATTAPFLDPPKPPKRKRQSVAEQIAKATNGQVPTPKPGFSPELDALRAAKKAVSLRRACKNCPPDAGPGGRPIGDRVANGSARGEYGSPAG